jgi:hypothetical protein
VESVSLPVTERRIDSVLRLERDGFVWYRHVEFQAAKDPDMPRRCFESNSRLILHYGVAVLTTVLYLLPGADKDVPDAFRLYVGDWLAFEWRFDVVRLWEIDAQSALETGEVGPLALVPLLRGGDEPSRVLEAARRLDAMPKTQAADAMSVLLGFAAQRYDRATFMNVLGKDRAMQSWLSQLSVEAEAKGEAKAVRQMCSDLVKEFHPGSATALLPAIEACDQPETLRSWTLQCAKLSDEAFVMLVTGKPGWAQGWWDGFVEGIRLTSRTMCLDVVERHHAAVLSLVEPVIKACPCPFQLKEWAVVSSEISDEAFVTLVTGKPPVRAARSRASRPSRRATSSKRG